MTDAWMGDMVGNKKEHTCDIGTRCSRARQWQVDFCRSHGTWENGTSLANEYRQ